MSGRVLITRSAERSADLLEALRFEQISVIAEPVTETRRIADASSLPELARVDWIAFTSANAVRALVEILAEAGSSLPADVRLAAIGSTTAKEVRQNLRVLDVITGSSGGAALAEAILESESDVNELTVLWPCAEDALPEFASELRRAGADVIEWPVYATHPILPYVLRTRLERPSLFEAVVFAAPSAVKSLHETWPEPWPFTAIAIGPTTAEALREIACLEPVVSLSARTVDILAAIKNALAHTLIDSTLSPTTPLLLKGDLT